VLPFAHIAVPLTQNIDKTTITVALDGVDDEEAPSFGGCDTPISDCQGDLEALS
jgi:hypothetical protein